MFLYPTWYCLGLVLVLSCGLVLVMSWSCLDPVLVLSWSCFSLVFVLVMFGLVLSWSCRGLVLVLSWSCLVILSWSCLGLVLVLSWSCLGLVLVLSWSCLGLVLVLSCLDRLLLLSLAIYWFCLFSCLAGLSYATPSFFFVWKCQVCIQSG